MGWPPHCLFVLADIDAQDLNDRLTRAHIARGCMPPSWDLWVASKDYDEMPKDSTYDGTVAPLPDDFKSEWTGHSILDCARWLFRSPGSVSIEKRYFVVIDHHCKNEDTVLVCRYKHLHNDAFVLEYFPQDTEEISMYMHTNDGGYFYERAHCYYLDVTRRGKPDRSHLSYFEDDM